MIVLLDYYFSGIPLRIMHQVLMKSETTWRYGKKKKQLIKRKRFQISFEGSSLKHCKHIRLSDYYFMLSGKLI